jgi:hypothetical protein
VVRGRFADGETNPSVSGIGGITTWQDAAIRALAQHCSTAPKCVGGTDIDKMIEGLPYVEDKDLRMFDMVGAPTRLGKQHHKSDDTPGLRAYRYRGTRSQRIYACRDGGFQAIAQHNAGRDTQKRMCVCAMLSSLRSYELTH